jgi:hypothetical protein
MPCCAPLFDVVRGYKIVSSSYTSIHHDDGVTVFRPGTVVRMPSRTVKLCQRGFHFCPRALDCLCFVVRWNDATMRLLTVEARPPRSSIARGAVGGVDVVVASTLWVVGEVEAADVARLLTGCCVVTVDTLPTFVHTWYVGGRVGRHEQHKPSVECYECGRVVELAWLDDGNYVDLDDEPVRIVYRGDDDRPTRLEWRRGDRARPTAWQRRHGLRQLMLTYGSRTVTIDRHGDVVDDTDSEEDASSVTGNNGAPSSDNVVDLSRRHLKRYWKLRDEYNRRVVVDGLYDD